MRWRANAVGKCAENQRRAAVGCRLSAVGCKLACVGCLAAVSWRRLSAVGRLQAGGGCRLSGGGCRAAVMGRYPRGGKSGGKRGERQTTTQRGRSAHRRGRQERREGRSRRAASWRLKGKRLAARTQRRRAGF